MSQDALRKLLFEPKLLEPKEKPTGDVGIDWLNPLWDGLVVYALDDVDLVSGNDLAIAGPLGRGLVNGHPGLYVSSTVIQTLTVPAPALDTTHGDGFTMIMLASWSGDANTRSMVSTPSYGINAAYDKTVDSSFDGWGGTGQDNKWPANVTTYVGRRGRTSTKRYSVLAGASEANGYTRGLPISGDAAGDWVIGYTSGSSQNTFWWGNVIMWNRHVSDAELQILEDDWYYGLKSENQTIITSAPVVAGGLAPTGALHGPLYGPFVGPIG